MLHSFVVPRLLPHLPAWTPAGRKVASSIVTKPFLALHLRDTDPDFVRVSPKNSKLPFPSTLPYEAAIYAQLEGVEGIPHIHWSGQDRNANVIVMDKLGLNLEHLRRFCRGQLGLKTILMLGEQMLSTIEHVHARGIIVRDIKPENFAMGYLEDYQRLYLFDMGLSKLYLDPTTGKHIPFREGRGGIGTPRYASHNVHFGLEPSRRDDVEAIGILLLYLLHGRLPWQGICAPDIPAKLRRIGEMKRGDRFTDLLARSPAFFTPFFAHCRALKFEEKPDYAVLRKLLREEMKDHGWEYDWKFDCPYGIHLMRGDSYE
ncbi:hypothetical protein PLEOSDRAFT_52844 [Pleurotus ostreatus PC15]|uniref:Protein kinase domain-containing protein n=1 Tax=Pleurotus ostreatus (strain PC15) TaxID=1137138 RepID=A0A067N971_PLEO1|nr:hypothetical protein PLEOSDRAFT_52844 [Pleurotus ostreatus PC15]